MSSRFLTNALSVVLGGFVVVASQAFAPGSLSWVAFAVAIAIAAVLLAAQLDRTRPTAQRLLDGAALVLAGLLVGFSRAFAGSAVEWLSFGLSLGVAGLGFAGLTVGEIANWRALRGLSELRGLGTASETPRRLTQRTDQSQAA